MFYRGGNLRLVFLNEKNVNKCLNTCTLCSRKVLSHLQKNLQMGSFCSPWSSLQNEPICVFFCRWESTFQRTPVLNSLPCTCANASDMSQRDKEIPEEMKVQRSASIKRHRRLQSVRKYVTRIFSTGFRFLIGLWILAQVHCTGTPLVVTNLPRPKYCYRYRARQICRILIPILQSKILIALAILNKYMSSM